MPSDRFNLMFPSNVGGSWLIPWVRHWSLRLFQKTSISTSCQAPYENLISAFDLSVRLVCKVLVLKLGEIEHIRGLGDKEARAFDNNVQEAGQKVRQKWGQKLLDADSDLRAPNLVYQSSTRRLRGLWCHYYASSFGADGDRLAFDLFSSIHFWSGFRLLFVKNYDHIKNRRNINSPSKRSWTQRNRCAYEFLFLPSRR